MQRLCSKKSIIISNIKIFTKDDKLDRVKDYFLNEKKPFVVRNSIKNNINLDFLNKKFKDLDVLSLNPKSEKEKLKFQDLVKKVKNGEKYRLRANTKIGNKLSRYIDTSFLESLKGNVFRPFDYLLSFGKTSRQKTLFLSTKNCTFTKHAHIISGLILHLEGEKTWYISKKREKFSDIKYKRLLHPNPLYVTEKNVENESAIILKPGDVLYMPAYWFHYTVSHNVNISYSHFFTEPIGYYLKNSFLMFFFQALTNPFYAIIKAIKKEPEEHIFDKHDILDNCNKISDIEERKNAINFFRKSDFS